jgi:Homing endonuclease associated repeat
MRGLLLEAGHRPPRQRSERHRSAWTDEEILDAIRRWHKLYGEPPTMADWDPYRARVTRQEWRIDRYDAGDWPSARSVRNRFGRLSTAVATAGLVPRRQGQSRVQAAPVLDPEVLLHVAAVRTIGDTRQPEDRLATALSSITAARAGGDSADLRVALVELAAAALHWAGELTPTNRA